VLSRRRPKLEFGCCICGEGQGDDAILGMTLFPPEDPDSFQQWWVHPRCIQGAMHTDFLADTREEIAMWWDSES
jgi:hypothetical protein